MQKQIILSEQDYNLISSIRKNENGFSEFCSNELAKELKTAKIISAENLPEDIVRINSTVRIHELEQDIPITIQLVSPGNANVKENKISIKAPLAAALIGNRKGDTVSWKMPGGIKRFNIVDVINE